MASLPSYGAVEHTPQERTALLRDTVRLTGQTNELAGEIHATLGQQRHSLEGGSAKVGEMKGFAGEARRTLNAMARRAALHRLMLYVIIVLLLLAIGATLYRMLTNNGRIVG